MRCMGRLEVLEPLQLESEVDVGHLTKLPSSRRAVHVPSLQCGTCS